MAVEHILPQNFSQVGGGEMAKNAGAHAAAPVIIDIRKARAEESILDNIKNGLRPDLGGDKTLPTLLLYDVTGLKLFEKITYLEEYYLTNTEIEVLEKYAGQIAERIQPNSIVLELGSG
jgi:L-histidine Nalpha-methyltransferase / hercynylcysteine S-oxide synthase